jgi:hypothetical protein
MEIVQGKSRAAHPLPHRTNTFLLCVILELPKFSFLLLTAGLVNVASISE